MKDIDQIRSELNSQIYDVIKKWEARNYGLEVEDIYIGRHFLEEEENGVRRTTLTSVESRVVLTAMIFKAKP